MAEEFLIQADRLISSSRKSYFEARSALDSQLTMAGAFQSGRALIQNAKLANESLDVATDEVLKLALTYASSEGIPHIDLVDKAKEKLLTYKDELCADLDKRNKQIGTSSTTQFLEETKTELELLVQEKAKVALKGWVKNEKAYAGNLLSPSLKFFNSLCLAYDAIIQSKAPKLKERFEAVYESMESDKPSHWANAVHECRKILSDLADAVYPAQTTPQVRDGKEIQVGKDQFVNRIACYVESKSDSKSYERVVTTQLSDFGEKLGALAKTTQKGSHSAITKEHAVFYIGEIYLLVGGVLSL